MYFLHGASGVQMNLYRIKASYHGTFDIIPKNSHEVPNV